MQNERAQTNDRLRVSKISGKFHIPATYNSAVFHP